MKHREKFKIQRVILVSLPNGMFGNGGQSWKSIDLCPLIESLKCMNLDVISISLDSVVDFNFSPTDLVLYSSSEQPEILGYIKDIFYFVNERCHIVPKYSLLLAHENKGFQDLQRKYSKFGNLDGMYHYDLDESSSAFPFVYKSIDGAGSKGVSLIKNESDLTKIRNRVFRVGLKRKILLAARRVKLSYSDYVSYRYRHKSFKRHLVQDFVPEMEFDYKVLVFGSRLYVLKRFVKDGDFRASGSGKFDFEADVPTEVLDFATKIYLSLDAPHASLDIVQSANGCHLIEYQALNFGPTTLQYSKGYYTRNGSRWEWVQTSSDLGEIYSLSIVEYLHKNFEVT